MFQNTSMLLSRCGGVSDQFKLAQNFLHFRPLQLETSDLPAQVLHIMRLVEHDDTVFQAPVRPMSGLALRDNGVEVGCYVNSHMGHQFFRRIA